MIRKLTLATALAAVIASPQWLRTSKLPPWQRPPRRRTRPAKSRRTIAYLQGGSSVGR